MGHDGGLDDYDYYHCHGDVHGDGHDNVHNDGHADDEGHDGGMVIVYGAGHVKVNMFIVMMVAIMATVSVAIVSY